MGDAIALTNRLDEKLEDKLRVFLRKPPDEIDLIKELTPKELEIFQRWEFANDMFRRKRNRTETVNLLVYKYKISPAQAYRDLRSAQNVFSIMLSVNVHYERVLMIDDLYKDIQDARAAGDLSAVARLSDQRRKLLHEVDIEADIDPADIMAPAEFLIGDFDDILPPSPKNFRKQLKEIVRRKASQSGYEIDAEDAEIEEDIR